MDSDTDRDSPRVFYEDGGKDGGGWTDGMYSLPIPLLGGRRHLPFTGINLEIHLKKSTTITKRLGVRHLEETSTE